MKKVLPERYRKVLAKGLALLYLAGALFGHLAPAILAVPSSIPVFSFGFFSIVPIGILILLSAIYIAYSISFAFQSAWKPALDWAYGLLDCEKAEPDPCSPEKIDNALQAIEKIHKKLLKEIEVLPADEAWRYLQLESARAKTRFEFECALALKKQSEEIIRLQKMQAEASDEASKNKIKDQRKEAELKYKILDQLRDPHQHEGLQKQWKAQVAAVNNRALWSPEQNWKLLSKKEKAFAVFFNCIEIVLILFGVIGLIWVGTHNQLFKLIDMLGFSLPKPLLLAFSMPVTCCVLLWKWKPNAKTHWDNYKSLLKFIASRFLSLPRQMYQQKCKRYREYLESNEALVQVKVGLQIFITITQATRFYLSCVYRQSKAQHEQLKWYISPQVKASTGEKRVDLDQIIADFLRPDGAQTVLLLKGPSAVGKSLSLQHVQKELQNRGRSDLSLPTVEYIELKQFTKDTLNLTGLRAVLAEKGYTEAALKEGSIVLLLDGYDEIAGHYQGNIYEALGLSQWPQIKVIISCRSEYLKPGDEQFFFPIQAGCFWPEGLAQWVLQPFSSDQIEHYIRLRGARGLGGEAALLAAYDRAKEHMHDLEVFVSSPFLLRMVAELLATPVFESLIYKQVKIRRTALYAAYIQASFTQQQRKYPGLLPSETFEKFIVFVEDFAFWLHQQEKVEARSDDPKLKGTVLGG
jgi:hypothetical protein